jgi:cell division topological specificity factor
MALLDFFLVRKKNTAHCAKERLQIIVAQQRKVKNRNEPDYFPDLKKEILQVISKYVKINPEMISIQLDQAEKDLSVLELNITLSE